MANQLRIKSLPTYTADIYVGFLNSDTAQYCGSMTDAHNIVQRFADQNFICVSLYQTEYHYTKGSEEGCVARLMNYPRFPAEEQHIRSKAYELALLLKDYFKQKKVSIVFTDETITLIDEDQLIEENV